MSTLPSTDLLRQRGVDAGLAAVGVTSADPMVRARLALDTRAAAGLADTMAFTYKNPARSTEPRRSVPWARSLVVGAASYLTDEPAVEPGDPGEPGGLIARYARYDAYRPLREGLGAVAALLREHGGKATVFADDNAVVDREAAWLAGIGWFGKNANLLLPGRGSWFVLGSVMTDLVLEPVAEPVADGCGTCRRCIDACPTDAIIAPGVVDARRCLAWVAQRPGPLDEQMRVALGTRIYGCDDCQDVCPPNQRAARIEALGAGHAATVDLVWLLSASDGEILERHGRWYLAERNPRWLRRNALVALGNAATVTPAVSAALDRYRNGDDDLLAEHAAWAIARLRGEHPEHPDHHGCQPESAPC